MGKPITSGAKTMSAVHAEWKNREVRPITAAECYEMAGKSWVAAAAQEALVRAAKTIEALQPLLAALEETTTGLHASCLIMTNDTTRAIALSMVKDARAAIAKAKGQ
jgi:hypothetical protein